MTLGGKLALKTWGPNLFEPANLVFWESIRREAPKFVKPFNPRDWISQPASLATLLREAGSEDSRIEEEAEMRGTSGPPGILSSISAHLTANGVLLSSERPALSGPMAGSGRQHPFDDSAQHRTDGSHAGTTLGLLVGHCFLYDLRVDLGRLSVYRLVLRMLIHQRLNPFRGCEDFLHERDVEILKLFSAFHLVPQSQRPGQTMFREFGQQGRRNSDVFGDISHGALI
ncbi:hypothetical protein [Methylotetracoccus oryzae]|uniref:hypothetical protein n=1 Tax=Methylotetracoccus oryzae TaxID=1919059 RepID=UPI001F1D7A3B|nr:hypothetical protein [Methylotetracoccus oryzae]